MPSTCTKNHSVAKRGKAEALRDLRKTTRLLKEELNKCNAENRRLEVVVRKLKRGSMSKVTAVVTPSPMPPNSQSATLDMENNAPETTNNGCVDSSLALKSGETVSIYAINCAKAVFSNEELETGIISPQKPSTRKILDPIRVNNIKKEVKVRFPNEWEEARRAINQHCRNVKAKRNNAPAVVSLLAE